MSMGQPLQALGVLARFLVVFCAVRSWAFPPSCSELGECDVQELSLLQRGSKQLGSSDNESELQQQQQQQELHCCDSETALLLVCDAAPQDYITGVPFAALGVAPEPGTELYQCGTKHFPGNCSARLEEEVQKECVGKRSCTIDPAKFKNPCPNLGTLQFRLRWSCHCNHLNCKTEAVPLPPVPLSAQGNIVVDASGSRFRFHGVNWAGAHITNAPGGLDRAPVGSIARLIRTLGFNLVRLTWSVESVLQNPIVEDRVVAANPQLLGLRALDVLDAVVMALQQEGILIDLDNHMSDSDWCCDRQDCDGFWFNMRFTEDDWVEAWRTLANRYAAVPAFVVVGLKNEPRSTCGGRSWGGEGGFCNATLLDPAVLDSMGCVEMQWARGPEQLQWRRAAERAGRAVLNEKESLLVSISGLDFNQDLTEFASSPVDLPRKNVIYEAHEYSWSTYSRWAGKDLSGSIEGHLLPLALDPAKSLCMSLGGQCSGVTCERGAVDCFVRSGKTLLDGNASETTHFKELQGADAFPRYADKLTHWWGYLLQENVAPVFLSEFGFSHGFDNSSSENSWVQSVSSYIQEGGPMADLGGIDWAYWALGGVQDGGTGRTAGGTESFGVLNRCWTGVASEEHYAVLRRLMSSPGEVAEVVIGASGYNIVSPQERWQQQP